MQRILDLQKLEVEEDQYAIEEGSAGIAKVAMRYGLWDRVGPMLLDAHRKYSTFAGLLFGLGGFVDVFTDAFLLSNDVKYLELAKRPIAGIRDIYLVKQPEGSTTPGDGFFRSSCDYATGSAGVMRALHRFAHLEQADFVLDEVIASKVNSRTWTQSETHRDYYWIGSVPQRGSVG